MPPQGAPLPSVLNFTTPGTYSFIVPGGTYMLFVEVVGSGASGASGQANGETGTNGNSGLQSHFALSVGGAFFQVVVADGGDAGLKNSTYGGAGTGGFSQPQQAEAAYDQLGLDGPAGNDGTAASGTTGGNGGAGAPSPLGLIGGGIPGVGVDGAVPTAAAQASSYPGAGGGGGAGAGGSSPGGGGGGGGAGTYTAGYVPVVPGQTYQVKVGAPGAAPPYPAGYPTCAASAGTAGAVIIHMYADRAVEEGALILDAQRHFGASGVQGSPQVTVAAGSNQASIVGDVMDGQGLSVPGAGASGATLYARVLSGGTTSSITLSVPAQTSVTDAVATHDDTAALAAFASALGSSGVGRIPPGTYNVTSFPTFDGGATVYADGAFVSINGAAAVSIVTLLPGWPAFSSLATTASTTSTTNVSTGEGVSVVCASSGQIRVDASCVANNSSSNDAVQVAVYESTAAVPAKGSAPAAGDTLIYQTTRTKAAANDNAEVTCHVIRSGLTAGTTYYYYHAIAAPGGGTSNALGGNNQTTIIAEAL